MTIQQIGGSSVALYITPDDLKTYGLSAGEFSLERALELTETAFDRAGISLSGTLEIEAFPDSCGILVFARIRSPELVFFSFPDFESVIRAAHAAAATEADSSLIRLGDEYILVLSGDQEQAVNILSEFGRQLPRISSYHTFLQEHGENLLPRQALSVLAGSF